MLHVITSNPVDIKHLKQYANNFILVHTYAKIVIPSMTMANYFLDVYHEEGMDLSDYDDYSDDGQFRYSFHDAIQPGPAIETIAEKILTEDRVANAGDQNDNPEEHMVAFACDYRWNQSAVKKFNSWMREHDSEITAVNLYSVLKAPSSDKLVEYIKMALSTEYVYPEDPIAFGYAVYQVLNGMVR